MLMVMFVSVFSNSNIQGSLIWISTHSPNIGMPSDLCREGIPDAEKAKEKIKKKFGICKPDDVAKVCHMIYLQTRQCSKGLPYDLFCFAILYTVYCQ